MPKFKDEDTVRIIAGEHEGKMGIIFGSPTKGVAVVPTRVAEGQEVVGEEAVTFSYEVDVGSSDETIWVLESELEAA